MLNELDTDTNALGISTCTAQPIIGCKTQSQGYCRQRLGECFLPCPDIKDREGAVENRKNIGTVFVISNPKLY